MAQPWELVVIILIRKCQRPVNIGLEMSVMVEKHGFFIDKGFKGSIIVGEGRVYKRKIMIHGDSL